MFTGIVEEVGTVRSAQPGGLTISARKVLEHTQVGDSISVNGACLTVTSLQGDTFNVEVMAETRRRTNLGQLRPGDGVNLERALTPQSRLGGHFVQGHVDDTGLVLALRPEEGAVIVRFRAPPDVMHYVVEKGFIAVDGVSLTVVERQADAFSVSLVIFTRQATTLGQKRPGDKVNLEADILGKYVERFFQKESGAAVTLEFLAEQGFLKATRS